MTHENRHQVPLIKVKDILYWWSTYVLLDILLFGILYHLNLVYNVSGATQYVGDVRKLWAYPLLGLFGKFTVIPQFPLMLIVMLIFRKSLMRSRIYLAWFPAVSFILAYLFLLILGIFDANPGNIEDAVRVLRRELGRWGRYHAPLNSVRPIALLSALIATYPWLFFLRRQYGRIKPIS